MRSRELASREYEDAWSEVAKAVELQIAEGETDPARIIERAWSSWGSGFRLGGEFRHYYKRLGVADDVDGIPTERLTVQGRAYRLVPFATPAGDRHLRELTDHVSSQASPTTA